MRLTLSLADADALASALAVIRPAMRALGSTALVTIDGARVVIEGALPMLAEPETVETPAAPAEDTPSPFAAQAVETGPEHPSPDVPERPTVAAGSPGEASLPRTGLPTPTRQGKAGNPQHTPWTEEQDARLAALWNEGASAAKIAAALGRTYGAVVQRLVLLRERGVGLIEHAPGGTSAEGGQAYTAQDDATLRRLRAEGRTFAEIGRALGRTGGACRMRLAVLEKRGGGAAVDPTPGSAAGVEPEPVAPASPEPSAPESLPAIRTLRGIPFRTPPADARLAVVTEAIREVGRADRPLLGPTPVEKAPPARPGTGDLRRELARHLDALGYAEGWTPRGDLGIVERALALGGASLAPAEVERFRALCRPIRETKTHRGPDGRGKSTTGNSLDGQAVLLELLRERAAVAGQSAAE